MAADIPPILIEFQGDIKGIKDSLVKVQNGLEKFDKETEKSTKATHKMGAAHVAVGAVMAHVFENLAHHAYAFAKESVTAYTDTAKETKGLMRTLGGTAEQMSRLDFASKELGVSTGVLTNFMVRVGVHMSANDKAAKALGVAYRGANGELLPSVTVLGNLADKFAGLPAGLDKTSLAVKTFGRGGIAMLPILNKGSKGLQELYKEADKLGLTLSGKNLKEVAAYTASQKGLHAAIKGVQFSIGKELVPKLTLLVSYVTNNVIPIFKQFIDGLTGAKDKLNGANTAAYNWGERIRNIIAIAWHFRNVIVNMGLVLVGMWAVSKIAAGASALVEVIKVVKGAYDALKTSALVAGIAETFALNPVAGLAAAVGVLALGNWVQGKVSHWLETTIDNSIKNMKDIIPDSAPPLDDSAPPDEKKKDGGGTPDKTLRQTLLEQVRQSRAISRLKRMGASQGLIDAVMGSSNWEKEYKKILTGGKATLVSLQNIFNKTDAGKAEVFTKAHSKHINQIIKAAKHDYQHFKTEFSKSTSISDRVAMAKGFLAQLTPLIDAAKLEEKKTRGTELHTKAAAALVAILKEQADAQNKLNALTKQTTDSVNAQAQAVAALTQAQKNNTSWLEAHQIRADHSNRGTITVPVVIDGHEVFRVVQKYSNQNNRRNVTSGLSNSGNVI